MHACATPVPRQPNTHKRATSGPATTQVGLSASRPTHKCARGVVKDGAQVRPGALGVWYSEPAHLGHIPVLSWNMRWLPCRVHVLQGTSHEKRKTTAHLDHVQVLPLPLQAGCHLLQLHR